MIVFGWRRRRPSDSESALTRSSLRRSSARRRSPPIADPAHGASPVASALATGGGRIRTGARPPGRRSLRPASPRAASMPDRLGGRSLIGRSAAGRCRGRLDQLRDRRESADEVGRPPRDELGAAERRQQPRRRRRIALERHVGHADLHRRVGVGDGDARQVVGEGECRGLLVAFADHDPGIVRLDPVDERRERTPAARSSSSEPRKRSNGWAIPTRPPWARISAIASAGGQVARNVPLEEHADQVAVAGPDFLADDHRQLGSGRPGDLAGREGTVDPVVIGDREVGQPARRPRPGRRTRVTRSSRTMADVCT